MFFMFGIDGFRFVKMEGLLLFGTVRKIFFRFFCSRTTAFSVRKVQQQVSILPPASHLLLAHLLTLSIAKKLSVWQSNPTRPTT